MARSNPLADRVRSLLGSEPEVTERSMFGGQAFFVNGNLACAASGRGLMVRLPHDGYDDALAGSGVEEVIMRGRPTRGWIRVSHAALEQDEALGSWMQRGIDFAASLPAK